MVSAIAQGTQIHANHPGRSGQRTVGTICRHRLGRQIVTTPLAPEEGASPVNFPKSYVDLGELDIHVTDFRSPDLGSYAQLSATYEFRRAISEAKTAIPSGFTTSR